MPDREREQRAPSQIRVRQSRQPRKRSATAKMTSTIDGTSLKAPPPKNQTFGKKAKSAAAIDAVAKRSRSSRARKKIAGKTSIAGDEVDRLQRAKVASE